MAAAGYDQLTPPERRVFCLDFENRTRQRAGVLNVFSPGGFEAEMPGIVEWFKAHGDG
jgi:hypothetical protein